ncbi:uncharacterized protein LOC144947354 isoform X1 [Lampetra fluviatilis]
MSTRPRCQGTLLVAREQQQQQQPSSLARSLRATTTRLSRGGTRDAASFEDGRAVDGQAEAAHRRLAPLSARVDLPAACASVRAGPSSNRADANGHVRGAESAPLLQQEQDRGALADRQVLVPARSGGRYHAHAPGLRRRVHRDGEVVVSHAAVQRRGGVQGSSGPHRLELLLRQQSENHQGHPIVVRKWMRG